ncbi:unnamed protein product [Boreogadus saida]
MRDSELEDLLQSSDDLAHKLDLQEVDDLLASCSQKTNPPVDVPDTCSEVVVAPEAIVVTRCPLCGTVVVDYFRMRRQPDSDNE